jgi:putative FmdB family regulatory protein
VNRIEGEKMPKYDFKCSSCQKITESFFPIQEGPAPAIICECGMEAFRVYAATPAQFKGGGWGGQ